MINIIVAYNKHRVIGKDGKIPWNLPQDMKLFKVLTWEYPIVMGRKTHESIGRLLPGRRNIIVTRQKDYIPCDVSDVTSMAGEETDFAIGIVAELTDNELVVKVSVVYENGSSSGDKLVVYLVEDEIIHDQTSYFNSDETSSITHAAHNDTD